MWRGTATGGTGPVYVALDENARTALLPHAAASADDHRRRQGRRAPGTLTEVEIHARLGRTSFGGSLLDAGNKLFDAIITKP